MPLLATYLRQILQSTVTYAFMYGYVQWLEAGRGLSASSAGLLLLPMSAAALVRLGDLGPAPASSAASSSSAASCSSRGTAALLDRRRRHRGLGRSSASRC